ncbi:acetyl-CoA synthetase-like protein [Ramaria rubella]|nr:acetyl-CoA synthetase-like protein [Ramaria rubella]
MSAGRDRPTARTILDMNRFPACNIHSFIFSNPFMHSSPLVKAWNEYEEKKLITFPPVAPHTRIYYDPDSGAALTYSRFRSITLCLAHGINTRFGEPKVTDTFGSGSRAGPVVLIHLANCLVWPVIALGFLAAGWTVTATNPGYTSSELVHVINLTCKSIHHADVEFFLVDPSDDAYDSQRVYGESSWTTLLSSKEFEVSSLSAEQAEHRIGFILWTSGTSGLSKGAMLTHRAIVAGIVLQCTHYSGYSSDERWIALPPFYHIMGLYLIALMAPVIGATAILVPKFTLEGYLRLATTHRATHLHFAPPVAVALANSELLDAPWCSLSSVKMMMCGGAPLASEIIREVWRRTGKAIKIGYGLTETGVLTSFRKDEWDDMNAPLGACGKPYDNLELNIIDENGNPVHGDKSGEIVVRTPAQTLGYLKNPQGTAATFCAYGFRTGDIGYIDGDGNLRVVDRLKELIKYKGFQVSPTELEGVIAMLPDVQDVAVSSLYSTAQGTELPTAYISPRHVNLTTSTSSSVPLPELVSLADKVKMIVEQNCIQYKWLRGGVVFLPAVPKSPSGKILRRLLKEAKAYHVQCYKSPAQSKL